MKTLLIAFATLCSATITWALDASITGIDAKKTSDGYEIGILGSGLERPKISRSQDGTSFVLDFSAHYEGKKQDLSIGVSGVKRVLIANIYPNDGHVRVTVKLEAGIEPQLISRDGQWIVLTNGKTATLPAPVPLEPQIETKPVVTGSTQTSPTTVPPDDKLKSAVASGKMAHESVASKDAQHSSTSGAGNTSLKPTTKPQESTSVLAPPPLKGPKVPIETNRTSQTKMPTKSAAQEVITSPAIVVGSTPVSLEFVNTDVAQVLKALAMQTSQNIILAPDVSPVAKPNLVTVALKDVSLEQALSDVTASSGLRFAKVDGTYFVAPEATFGEVIHKVMASGAGSLEYRVISLSSGEADLIRSSTMKSLPPDGSNGYYEIVATDDKSIPITKAPAELSKVADPNAGTNPGSLPLKHANYLVLIGSNSRLDSVEKYVKDMDSKLADATMNDDTGIAVIAIQSGESQQILETLNQYLAGNPRANQFKLKESTAGSAGAITGARVLSIMGPKAYIPKLEAMAKDMDRGFASVKGVSYAAGEQGAQLKDEVISLQHVDPVIMLARIKDRFPNVRVWTLPDPISSNSGTQSGGGASSSTSGGSGGAAGGTTGGSTPAPSGGSTGAPTTPTATPSGGTGTATGLEPMRILVQAAPSVVEELKQFIALIDIEPPTIALELRVLELSKDETDQMGLDFNFLNTAGGNIFRINNGIGTNGQQGTIPGNFGMPGGNALSFLQTLDRLDNGRRLIARPNALISDGRSAHIFVGDTIRYIKSIQSTQNGITITDDELKVGVTFDIGARVSPGGDVTLDLNALFNILKGFTAVPGGGSLPQTADRSTHLPVNMRDGETIAIGGLITDQDSKSYGGIPFLKDLPIIGKLFGRTNNARSRTEIVFFVTTKLVNHDNRATAASPRESFKKQPDPLTDYLHSGGNGKGTVGADKGKGGN